jgi:hypothetical protein
MSCCFDHALLLSSRRGDHRFLNQPRSVSTYLDEAYEPRPWRGSVRHNCCTLSGDMLWRSGSTRGCRNAVKGLSKSVSSDPPARLERRRRARPRCFCQSGQNCCTITPSFPLGGGASDCPEEVRRRCLVAGFRPDLQQFRPAALDDDSRLRARRRRSAISLRGATALSLLHARAAKDGDDAKRCNRR